MITKLYFYHIQYPWSTEGVLDITSMERTETDTQILICALPVDLPDISILHDKDRIPKVIKHLEAKKQEIQANAFKEVKEIDSRIQELLCIESKEVNIDIAQAIQGA